MPSISGETLPRSLRSRTSLTTLVLSSLTLACGESTAPTSLRQAGAASSAAATAAKSEVIPGQYIITFADTVSDVPGLAKRIANQYGSAPIFTYESAIKGFAAQLPAQAIEGLSHNPQIQRIELDQIARRNDTETGATWGLDRIDQRALPMDGSYSYRSNGSGVNVYILDTGIRPSHVEFGGRASGVFSSISDGRGTADCDGHGTHVAGTVGGAKYGVAKGVKLYAVRVLDCTGNGTWSGIIAGIDWVTKNRVLPAVANMSLGGAYSLSVNSAVQSSIQSGVVYVVAAGNNSADACGYSPASTPEALTVGAVGNIDSMQGFSNFGRCLDLFAPGQAIRSAYAIDDTSSISMAGTSMASPHVAGAAALYLALNPSASPTTVAAAITSNATSNALTGVPSGTPNLLLYTQFAVQATPLPSDTTTSSPAPGPAPIDQPPVAAFSSNCARGKCTFDASSSNDDHGIIGYAWNYGDGSVASSGSTLVRSTHTYTKAGTYKVTVTVTDASGQKTTASTSLVVKKV